MQTPDFQKFKALGRKISMITCYDYWSAQLLNQSEVDCILVGDSLAMVMHGHPTTLPASIEVMALHTAAVSRGAPDKFVIGDLPFLSYRKSLSENMSAVEMLMKSGAQAVKLEGAAGNLELIRHLVESGVPVMGHLGLTPQSIHQLGGFRVQAKDRDSATLLAEQALALQDAGCFSLVLECVPSGLAERVSQSLIIPTIGIGAGPYTDGQVLVMHDMLGFNQNFEPKFLRRFQNFAQPIIDAVNRYNLEVKESTFPHIEESYE